MLGNFFYCVEVVIHSSIREAVSWALRLYCRHAVINSSVWSVNVVGEESTIEARMVRAKPWNLYLLVKL